MDFFFGFFFFLIFLSQFPPHAIARRSGGRSGLIGLAVHGWRAAKLDSARWKPAPFSACFLCSAKEFGMKSDDPSTTLIVLSHATLPPRSIIRSAEVEACAPRMETPAQLLRPAFEEGARRRPLRR